MDKPPRKGSANEALKAMVKFASCIVARRDRDVGTLLSTPVGSDDEKGLVAKLAQTSSACLGGYASLKFDATLLRGAVAEAYFSQDL